MRISNAKGMRATKREREREREGEAEAARRCARVSSGVLTRANRVRP